MSSFLEGEIKVIYENYGIVTANVAGKKIELYFLILPEMFTNDKFILTKKVKFKTRKIEVRKSDVLIAYNLKSFDNEEIFEKNSEMEEISVISASSYYEYLFKSMANQSEIDSLSLKKLISSDKAAKEFFLKWILYIESTIKTILIKLTIGIDTDKIYNKLENYSNTKSIVSNRFKNIKNEYMFKPEYNLLKLKQHGSDPNNNKVIGCPIFLFLEALTLTELGEVLNVIIEEELLYQKCDEYKCLYYIKDSFIEMSFIRNKSAHGNPLIPHILDNNFNPSYMYEMASAFPDWNISTNVENWSLFNFIRHTARSLAKRGIPLTNSESPMESALFFTKSLLINPAKRSFFMFFYVMMVITEYLNVTRENDFWNESMVIINNFSSFKLNENIFNYFPSKDYSIKNKLSRVIIPLITYKMQGAGNFKMSLEIAFDLGRSYQTNS